MPGSVVRMIPTGPGIGTCDPLGQNLWCAGDITGAWFNDAWKTFRVWALAPTISSFSPASGPVGAGVTISGSHFTGATAVAFNGAAASFAVNSDTQITATVPSGATTGPISVTTPGGAATRATSFTVTVAPSAPMISSFSPASARAEARVTISGSHFTRATGVAFNGAAASFAVDSDTQITATVPSGATTGPISLTT